MGLQRVSGAGREGSYCLMGTEWQSGDGTVLEMTVVTATPQCEGRYPMPLRCALKRGENGKFHVLCILPQ